MTKFLTGVVMGLMLPIVFIIYLIHRFLDLLFGGMNIFADGFDKAAELINRLPGGIT